MPPSASLPILVYHSVASTTTRAFAPFTIEPALFDEHLAALREQAIDVIPFREVPAALAAGRRAVSISLDDGLADTSTEAAPALLRYGLPATMFVPSGFVGDRTRWMRGVDRERPTMGWPALAELAHAGFEIGSHGRLHLSADVNQPELINRDAIASRRELEDHLGRTIESFAYPFGHNSLSARRAVRGAGFAQACVVGDFPARASDDRWALPRLDVRSGTSTEALLAMIARRPSPASRGWSYAKKRTSRVGRRVRGQRPRTADSARRVGT